jgi:hypothetical protein
MADCLSNDVQQLALVADVWNKLRKQVLFCPYGGVFPRAVELSILDRLHTFDFAHDSPFSAFNNHLNSLLN